MKKSCLHRFAHSDIILMLIWSQMWTYDYFSTFINDTEPAFYDVFWPTALLFNCAAAASNNHVGIVWHTLLFYIIAKV